MGNYKQDFINRGGGELAENKAKKYYEDKGYSVARSGLDEINSGIPKYRWYNIPSKIRKLPDYIVMNDKSCRFVEVKGCSKILKFKLEE